MISKKYPNAKITEHRTTTTEKIILFLINPIVSGLLIVLIIGGIYLEIQSPGIGFPIILAFIAATLFFAPLYLQGLANNWEIILFFTGLILIAVEIFILPGFGVAGVLGLLAIISSLALSLISIVPSEIGIIAPSINKIVNAFAIVTGSIVTSIVISFLLSKKILLSDNVLSSSMVLRADGKNNKYNLSSQISNSELIGKKGVAVSRFMPSGKILINNEVLDAIAISGYLNKDQEVLVLRISNGQLVVREVV
jgi:membrane-bound serine protease (ClpP class)